ncbi:uncharacterized protein N7515_004420, partial [Penicillium bovifimosum]
TARPISEAQTRRDPPRSLSFNPLLPCPYPISPLTFATTDVSFEQITKSAIDSLCLCTARVEFPSLLLI